MWPVDALRPLLPESFRASEDKHFVELRCERCGWTATFSAAGATAEEILKAARAHRCPGLAGD